TKSNLAKLSRGSEGRSPYEERAATSNSSRGPMSYRLMGVAGSDLVGGSIPSGPAKNCRGSSVVLDARQFFAAPGEALPPSGSQRRAARSPPQGSSGPLAPLNKSY